MPVHLRWALHCIRLIAGEDRTRNGVLPNIGQSAFKLHMTEEGAQGLIDDLIERGWIDILPDQALRPTGWGDDQPPYSSSTQRMQKLRARKNKSDADVTRSDVTSDVTCDADVTQCASSSSTVSPRTSSIQGSKNSTVDARTRVTNRYASAKDGGVS
jgi:hypothetical protein